MEKTHRLVSIIHVNIYRKLISVPPRRMLTCPLHGRGNSGAEQLLKAKPTYLLSLKHFVSSQNKISNSKDEAVSSNVILDNNEARVATMKLGG